MATVHVVLRPQVGVFPVLLRRPCSIIDEADLAGPLRWILCECSSVHPFRIDRGQPEGDHVFWQNLRHLWRRHDFRRILGVRVATQAADGTLQVGMGLLRFALPRAAA